MKIETCPKKCAYHAPYGNIHCRFSSCGNYPEMLKGCPLLAIRKLKKRNEILMLALRLSVPRKYLVPELIKQAYREMRKK